MDSFSKLANLIVDFIKQFIETIRQMVNEFRSINDEETTVAE